MQKDFYIRRVGVGSRGIPHPDLELWPGKWHLQCVHAKDLRVGVGSRGISHPCMTWGWFSIPRNSEVYIPYYSGETFADQLEVSISQNLDQSYRWVRHTQNFMEKTFAGGSQTAKFVKAFSLENGTCRDWMSGFIVAQHNEVGLAGQTKFRLIPRPHPRWGKRVWWTWTESLSWARAEEFLRANQIAALTRSHDYLTAGIYHPHTCWVIMYPIHK